MNKLTLASELAHLSKKESSKIFDAMSWNFLVYLFSTWKISSDMEKYSMTCHQIFCHITKVFFGINKGLLILTWTW
jgi:hypothetical protein